MDILSPYTITWDATGTPLVLVNAGQRMAEELRWPTRQAVIGRAIIGAAMAGRVPRRQVESELQFTAYETAANGSALRAAIATRMALMPWGLRKTLTIAISGGSTIYMHNCVLAAVDPQPLASAPGPRAAWQYSLKGDPPTSS
jgi:hypothetical protein